MVGGRKDRNKSGRKEMKQIQFQKLDPKAVLPNRAYEHDAGLDVTTIESVFLEPGEGRVFKTGLACAVDPGFVAMICDRSSMGKRGLRTMGGIVDSGYRGEVGVILWNVSAKAQKIEMGERIAQILILPVSTPTVVEAVSLPPAERGAQGFGSSGK